MAVKQLGAAPTIPAHAATKSYVDLELNLLRGVHTERVIFGPNGQWPAVNGSSAALTNCGLRMVIDVPEPTTRWRMGFQNFNQGNLVAANALTGKGIKVGRHVRTGGDRTGNFVASSAVSLVSSDFTIPGDGSYYLTSWFTDPTEQLDGEHILAVGYTQGSSTAVINSVGECWQWATSTSALDDTVTTSGTLRANTPLGWYIEYETLTARNQYLFLGDSIMEGITGLVGTTASTIRGIPMGRTWPRRWADQCGALASVSAMAGFPSSAWNNALLDPYLWDRYNLATTDYKALIVHHGTNDINANDSLATLKTNYVNMIEKAFTKMGKQVPLILVTLLPRTGFDATKNGIRRNFNAWLHELPLGAVACMDPTLDFQLGTSLANQDSNAVSMYTDGIHPSYQGLESLRKLAATTIPLA
jgi:hypothetical protein